jgi:hypothetical protein
MKESSSDIVKQMERIRAKRPRRLTHLAEQTERLTDWREHVRATPVTAFLVSMVGGMLVAKGIFAEKKERFQQPATSASFFDNPFRSNEEPAKVTKAGKSLIGHVAGLGLSIGVALLRRQILNAIAGEKPQSQSKGVLHGQRQPH